MHTLDFLLISDPKVWSMPVDECHEPLVDLRTKNIKISLARATYYAGYTKVRQMVAEKLLLAFEYLPEGVNFYFSEGHRPITLQKRLYDDYYQHLKKSNPTWDGERLKFETAQYVAPPFDVPPHSTGGAIDITLIDDNGEELDMGGILDETPDANDYKNFTHTGNISPAARANREILIKALSNVGFVNYPAEWWHWSYGDKYWAYHMKYPHAIYGSVE